MHAYARKLRYVTTLALAVFAASLLLSAAQAQDAVQIAHQALRQRILHDAGDRYEVRFLTTRTNREGRGMRSVTGQGRFRRRGKSAQRFTYHCTVEARRGRVRDIGYDLR